MKKRKREQSKLVVGPISKMELTALLKKYPELTGKGDKATYQRRVFRKTINKIAGKEVFEENYEYTGKQLQVDKRGS